MLDRIVLRNADDSGWQIFEGPLEVLTAQRAADVLPVMIEAERRVNEEDLFAAGFVSYEAASGFDPAHKTKPAGQIKDFIEYAQSEAVHDLIAAQFFVPVRL